MRVCASSSHDCTWVIDDARTNGEGSPDEGMRLGRAAAFAGGMNELGAVAGTCTTGSKSVELARSGAPLCSSSRMFV
jgi:hypothetical protein